MTANSRRARFAALPAVAVLLAVAVMHGCGTDASGPNGVMSVVVTPPAGEVRAGATMSFAVTLRNATGGLLFGRPVTWRSADTLIAEVAQTGVVTGRATGTTRITAMAEGVEGSAQVVVVPGVAVSLTFDVSPATAVVGAAFVPAVRVTAHDAMGNVATDFVGNVTIALGANPVGGTLSGSTSVSAVAGVAIFSGLSLDKIGDGYSLTATATGLTGAASPAFAVTPGPAATLEFTVAPHDTTAGAVFNPAIQVTARDAMNNVATGFNGPVTISLGTNPAGGTLGGTTTANAVAGVAIFATLSVDRIGGGYTLTAAAAGLPVATTAPFAITVGPPSQLAFVVQPLSDTAGAVLTAVQVAAQDAGGNLVVAFTGSITVAFGANPGGGTLSGTTTASAVAGVATFATLSIDRSAAGYRLTASAAGLTGATSNAFTVNPGTATRLVFAVEPGTATAGIALTPAVQVAARDALGNTATGFSGSVTMALGSNPGGGTLSGITIVNMVAGVANFGTVSINRSGVGYTLTATVAGLPSATSAAFTVVPGSATQLAFTVQPGSDTAGAVLTPAVQVTARDAHGNTATGFTGPISIALGTNPGGGTLSGATTASAVAGIATFATLRVNRTGVGYTLTAATAGLNGATSAAFTVTPGSASQLAFTVQPVTDTARAVLTPAVQVTARDAEGNTVPGFTGLVSVAIGTNPGGGTLGGTTTVSAVGGVATFATLSIDRVGAGYRLTAAAAGLIGSTSAPFTVNPGSATQLVFTVQPVSTTAGAQLTPAVQVTALDAQGNTASGYTGSVAVALANNPGGGTLSGTTVVNAVAGVASFATLSLNRTGAGYTLTAAATGLGGAVSATFNIAPGAASQLAFTGQPVSDTAGAVLTPAVQVTARDAQGNTATGFSGPITLAIGANPGGGSLTGTTTVNAAGGVATFATLSINASGSGYTLAATATGLGGASSAPFTIQAGTATHVAFIVQPGTDTAGALLTPAVQVAARDARGNIATGFSGSIGVALGTNPGGGTLSGTTTVSAVAGVATFGTLSIDRVGAGYTLTAVAGALGGATSAAFTITPGTATQLAFTAQPPNGTAGEALMPAVQVTARDAHGNTATGFTGPISIGLASNPGGGTLGGTTTESAVAGVASFATLSVDRTGAGYTLSATGTGLTVTTSAGFTITPGTATQLAFTVQPVTDSAGAVLTPAVQVAARDAHGNTATGFTGAVTVAIGSNPGGGTLSGTTTVGAVAGVASFATLSIGRSGIGYTLTAAAPGLSGATSAAFTVTTGPPTQLVFTVQPGSDTAGAVFTPAVQVTARDGHGNVAIGFNGPIRVALGANPGGATLGGTTTVNAVNGVASFATLSVNRTGAGYTMTAAADGLPGATSVPFTITPGTASQLAFTVQPVTDTAGAVLTPAVEVTARDGQGNTVTGFAGSVSVAIAANPGGGTLSGTTTVSAISGVATFATLSIDRAGSGYTLTAAAVGPSGSTSAPFSVTAGTATHLAFTVEPRSDTAGAVFTPPPQVVARDARGNVATGFTGPINVALGANPGGGTLSGTTTVSATAGMATFATLQINRTGADYTLAAAAAGLTSTTSAAFTITPGTASQLAFTVQPVSDTAGAVLTPAVQVTARDGQGNVATGFAAPITVAIGTNPGGGTLGGSTTASAAAGVASFATLSVDRTGVGYTLTAAATGVAGATSAAFTITSGTATQLAFTVQPVSDTAGAVLTPAVQVSARDAYGNTATGFTGPISVALGANPGGGTLSGTTTASAVAGVASFATLSINRIGTGYSLTGAATGLSQATSALFNVTAGSATELVFTVQPVSDTAGAVFTPAVQVAARDAHGNTASGFTGLITIAIGTNPGGGTLSGTTAVSAVAGVATFSTLQVNRTGVGYTLTAAASGLAGATSAAFTIRHGTASQLAFTVQPGTDSVGAVLTPAVQVTARDPQGNTVATFSGLVSVAIGTNPGGSTLTGTTAVGAVAGVATFATLRLDRVGIGYTLTAAAASLSGATSAAFTVTSGRATRLVFTVQPASDTAAAVLTPAVRVTALDARGNIATGFSDVVSVGLASNPGGGTLSGTTAVNAVAGVATFATLSVNRTGIGYSLSAVAAGLSGTISALFTVTPGSASQLVFTVQPYPTDTAGAILTPAVQVTARDAQGNTATGFAGLVTMAIGTNPGGGALSGATTVSAVAGVARFTTLSVDRTGVGYTLMAAATGVSGATSTAFNVTPGTAIQLAFTVQPATSAAGVPITPAVEVTARDAHGNTAPFGLSIFVAIGANPGGSTLSGTTAVSPVNGVASFASLRLNRPGVGYTLTAGAAGLSGATSAPFTVTSSTATQLVFTVHPGTDTAGAVLTPAVQVTALDAQGNAATGFTDAVTVAIGTNPGGGTLGGTTTVSAVGGVASFTTLSIDRTGAGYTLTAAAPGLTGATSTPFAVTPGAATQLAFTVQPYPTDTAGAVLTPAVQVSARDIQGNIATSFTGPITVAIGTNPGGSTLSGTTTVSAVAGVATFATLSLDRTGIGYTLTAAAAGLSGATSTPFAVTPGRATQLAFTVQPGTTAAGVPIAPAVEVTVRDAYGNTAPFALSIFVTIGSNPGGSTLSGTTAVSPVNGVASFASLRLNRPGVGYTLSAGATGLTSATSAPFTVSSSTATQLVFSVQPVTDTAAAVLTPAVQVAAVDALGNTATNFTDPITIAIGANPAGGTLSGTTTVSAVNGVATFATLSLDRSGAGYTLIAAAAGLTSATSTAFNVSAGTATVLTFTVQPGAATAGAAITPAVQVAARDAQGNIATGFAGGVTLAIAANPGGGALNGTTTESAVNGVASFATLSIDRAGAGYTLAAAAGGLSGATSAAFSVFPGPATQLAFTVEPAAPTAGAPLTPAVQVTARDAQGNTATGFSGSVTVAIGTNPSGSTLGGTRTVNAVAGVATFATLTLNVAGAGYTLTAVATGLGGTTSAAFTVNPGTATQLAFTAQPVSDTAGAVLTPAVQVTARDALGNTATGFTGPVSVAIAVNPGAGTLGGTTTVSAEAGVATFPTLSINRTGAGYTLAAASSGLTGATSAGFNVTPGTPSQLAFTVQPYPSDTAGAVLSPAVRVTAQDGQGNTAAGFGGIITVALGANPGGGTLNGTTTVSAVAGVATFATLSLNRTGTGYTLTAAAAGLAGVTSTPFTVTHATATQLEFTVQPGPSTAGVAITPAVQVTVRDAYGNVATTFGRSIYILIDPAANPGGSTLLGNSTPAPVNGVASWSVLRLNRPGVGYRLIVGATGLSEATSAPFNVIPGPAAQLVFTVPPGTDTAGAVLPVQITALDSQGNTATSFTDSVTVAIGTNPGVPAGTLSGTTKVQALAGVATFATLRLDRTGVGYTLTAGAPGFTNAISPAFSVTPGTATQLGFTVQPGAATAGAAITPAVQVTARDAQGNIATGFTGNVSAALGTNPGGSTLSGTTTVSAVNGVATFATLSLNVVGTGYTLTAAAAGLSGATSAAFAVSSGAATQLFFTVQPVATTAGAAITPAVQVTARDAQGNIATGFTGSVTVAIGTNPGGSALSGTRTVNAVAGVATFATLTLNVAGTGYTLTAAATGIGGATSTAFNINPGTASQLFFTVQPGTTTAGATIAPAVQITARDPLGNTATGFTGLITVAIGVNPAGGTLSGTTAVSAVAGVASFPTLSINRTGAGYTLSATATGPSPAISAAFNINAGPAAQLAFTVQPGAATAGAVITPAVQVTARDAQGNVATAFTGSVTMAIGTNPGGSTLSGTTAVNAVAGVATFTTLSLNRAGAGYTLTAAAAGVSGATSAAFTVGSGTATQLVFTVQPVTTTAGVAITPAVQVTARDAQGNTATGFTGSVTVAIGANPGGSTLSGSTTLNAVAGVASFATLSLNVTGTGYTLTTAATGLSGATSTAFNITPGTASQLVFTVQPSTTTAGATIAPAVQITARDPLGNVATAFTGSVTMSIATNPGVPPGTLSGTTTLNAVAGVANFATLSINRTGIGYTLSASATGPGSTTSTAFNINPGAATQLAFTLQPGPATAGAVITPAVQVTARDAQGNVATGFGGNVTVALGTNPSGATLSGTTTVSAVSGVASFATLSVNLAGTGYTLTAAATGLSGATSAAFSVSSGTATQLAFTVQPVTTTAGAAITPAVQVTARDAQGNTATGYNGSVTVAIASNPGGSALSGTTTVNAVAGVATFATLSLNVTGTGYTLTATATGASPATSTAFNITAGTASQLVFTVQPGTATAGAVIAPAVQVTARDAQGNTATGFTGVITVVIGTNPGVPPGVLSGTTAVSAVAGVANFVTLSINRTGIGYTLTASATGPTPATSAAFTVNPGAATQLAFTLQPGTTMAGAVIAPAVQVTARDAQGNVATGFAGSVTVAIGTNPGGGILSGTTLASAVNGVVSFATLSINRTGVGYTLTAASGGLAGATSTAFTVTPGTATQLVFTVQPVTTTAGAAITPAVQVTARDAQGNTATDFGGSVTVAIGTNPGGSTLGGTTTVNAVAGVATFTTLSLNVVGTGYTLTAGATGASPATSAAFNITHGAASQLFFTVQPGSATAGAVMAPVVQVTARDAQGNTATGFTGVITVAIGTNPGVPPGVLSGTTAVSAVAGVASFATLSINRTGAGYTLTASATGPASATSAAFSINPGAATQLAFTVQPPSDTASAVLAPAVQIAALDAQGNVATSFTGSVTVAIGTNPGGGTLSGTTIASAVGGVVSFATLSINRTGTGYTLTATATGLTSATSAAFTINPGTATQLVFTVQPITTTAGAILTPAVQVTARDAQGNTATGFTGLISVAIGTNPGGGTLSGTTNVSAVAGVATFATLSVDRTGVGYTLTAATGGAAGATSAGFNITPGTATQLAFTLQPATTAAGVAISPAVQVTARDAFGNTATAFTGSITVAIGANPGGGALSGTVTVSAVAGVASFATLSINAAGTGYTLTAVATGLSGATSDAFTITAGT